MLVASHLFKYPVSVYLYDKSLNGHEHQFCLSMLQDSFNLAHYICLSTGFLVNDKPY